MILRPEGWFLRELKLIAPQVYPHYFTRYKKWMIVRDFTKRVPGITDYDPVVGKNFVVELVVEDKSHRPLPLDGRVLKGILLSLNDRNRYPFFKYLNEIDREEEEKGKKACAEMKLRQKDAGKKIKKFLTSETFT